MPIIQRNKRRNRSLNECEVVEVGWLDVIENTHPTIFSFSWIRRILQTQTNKRTDIKQALTEPKTLQTLIRTHKHTLSQQS